MTDTDYEILAIQEPTETATIAEDPAVLYQKLEDLDSPRIPPLRHRDVWAEAWQRRVRL